MKHIEQMSKRYTLLSFLCVYGMYALVAVSSILFAKYKVVPQIPGVSIDIQFLIDGFMTVISAMLMVHFASQRDVILSCTTSVLLVVALIAIFGLLLVTAADYRTVVLMTLFFLIVMGFDIIIVILNTIKSNFESTTWVIILACIVFGTLVLCYFRLHVGIYYMVLCVLCELLSIIYLRDCVSKVYDGIYQNLSNNSYKLSTVICIILEEISDLWIELIWLPFMCIPMIKERFGK